MKNSNTTCPSFSTKLNNATDKFETAKTSTKTFKNPILALFCLAILLISTSSCSREIASGCGAWPTMKLKDAGQYRSDSWPLKLNNNKQFANYKGYN